jgi:hypothetical protein
VAAEEMEGFMQTVVHPLLSVKLDKTVELLSHLSIDIIQAITDSN